MFKELLPQNEALGILLDTVFISLGGIGGIAGLITFRWKTKYQAKIQAEMQTKADELSQSLSEKITRRSKANDMLVNRKYAFYDELPIKVNALFAAIVNMESSYYVLYDERDIDGGKLKENTFINNLGEFEKLTSKFFLEIEAFRKFMVSYIYYTDKPIHELTAKLYSTCISYKNVFVDNYIKCYMDNISIEDFKKELLTTKEKAYECFDTLSSTIYDYVKVESQI